MLIRHTVIYTLGRGASGIVNLLALSLYTRLLHPAEYGRYALVLVWVGVVNVLVFQWLHLGARRFLSAYSTRSGAFLSAIGTAYLRVAGAIVLLAIVAFLAWPDRVGRQLIALGALLLCSQAWLELNLDLSLAGLKPIRYGTLNLIRSVVGLACGGVLAYAGIAARGVLLGTIVGYLVPGLIVAVQDWRGVAGQSSDSGALRDVLRYGLPLTAAYALTFVVTFSDRVLLAWLRGPLDVGMYAAAYDLTFQGLMVLMTVVNLSAFQLAVRELEQRGVDAARTQLKQHAILLLAVATPATVGLALLAPNVARVLLGGSFQSTAAQLIPWLALGTFIAGVKSFYFDLSFQLGRATTKQVWVSACAAVVNVGLNLWWIPAFGVMGAAWGSLVAFIVAGAFSIVLGRHVFRMPIPLSQWARIAGACAVMALSLLPLTGYRGISALVGQIALGGSVYLVGALLLNVGDAGTTLVRALRRP
jgi:O-antigen/teichoic acid export membrane protein